jgi:molecular chaperone DnaK
MVKQAEEMKDQDMKRREMVDIKNEAHNTYETTKRQLDEFRSKLPANEIENIEKALSQLAEWKDKDLKPEDKDSVKTAIENAKNAAMKIGQVMYQNQGSSSSGNQGQEENKEEGEKKEEAKKKN